MLRSRKLQPNKYIVDVVSAPQKLEILSEGVSENSGQPKVIFRAKLQTAQEKNQNGRIYSYKVCESIVNQLKDKEPVWFGSDCGQGADWDDGVWDDETFDRDLLFQINTKLSKAQMLDTRDSAMNHAMVITGVNLDNDKPTKWKIENSWGEKVAHKGYYVASDSWFDKFVYQAVVDKKYLSSEELSNLENEPIELEPWDPMGTLA